MKRLFLGLSFAPLLLLLLTVPAKAADGPALVPTHFNAAIGGFLGASYSVELRDDGSLDYGVSGRGQPDAVHTKINPTPADWREFRATLDALKVWKWRARYSSDGIMDGTQWSLDIAYADCAVKSQGSNNYPDDSGKPTDKPETTPAFKQYLAAVKKLAGGRVFE